MKNYKRIFLLLSLISINYDTFADGVSKNLKSIESSVNFSKPIIGGYNYNFKLYLTNKDNVANEISNINIIDDKNLRLLKSIESNNNQLSTNDNIYLIKSSWASESDGLNYYVNNIKTYTKNPLVFSLNYEIRDLENNKSCLYLSYDFKNIIGIDKQNINDNEIYVFSTTQKNGQYNCLFIKNKKYLIIDSVNLEDFYKFINKKLNSYELNKEEKDSYLLLEIEKE